MLVRDVNMSGAAHVPIGTSTTPFTGVFDGNGHVLSNLASYGGLFGYVGKTGVVKNLGLDAVRVEGPEYIGALAARNAGTIAGCYSTGSVTARASGSRFENVWAGGLVGDHSGTMDACYSTAEVKEAEGAWIYAMMGGLVGANSGEITHCYSAGAISGYVALGLVGVSSAGQVVDSFWDVNESHRFGSAGGVGLTTAEMRKESTFFAWGVCVDGPVWTIDDGRDYPRLLWQNRPGKPLIYRLSDFLKGDGTPENPYLIYTLDDMHRIWEFPDQTPSSAGPAGRAPRGGGTAPRTTVGATSSGAPTVTWRFPCEQEKHFRLAFLSGEGTEANPYLIRTRDEMTLLWQCPYGQDSHFRLAFLSGQGTQADPYLIRTAEDMDLLRQSPYEQNAYFRLAFLTGDGTETNPYLIRTVGEMNLLRLSPRGQDAHFRLAFLTGEGTQASPYLISTADDLNLLGQCPWGWTASFRLVATIDLAENPTGINVIEGPFEGVFDGNGHTISHFRTAIATEQESRSGPLPALFATIGWRGEVKNLGITDVNIIADAGTAADSLFGPLVASNLGYVNHCWSTGRISGGDSIGGLVGKNEGIVSDSKSTVDVTGRGRQIGGLVGENYETVSTSCATGKVSGSSNVGGLVGHSYRGTVSNSYSTNTTSGGETSVASWDITNPVL